MAGACVIRVLVCVHVLVCACTSVASVCLRGTEEPTPWLVRILKGCVTCASPTVLGVGVGVGVHVCACVLMCARGRPS